MKPVSISAFALLIAVNIPLMAHAESKSFLQSLKDGYQTQATKFSDEALVDQLNGSDWGWAWVKPNHLIDEANRRIALSSSRSLALTKMFLTSFENRGVKGSYTKEVFTNALSNAASGLNLSRLSEIEFLVTNVGKVFAEEYPLATKSFVFEKLITPAYNEALTANFDRAFNFYNLLQASANFNSDQAWITRSFPQADGMRVKLLSRLIPNAQAENFPTLQQLYMTRNAGLDVLALLAKMYQLQPQQTVQLVRTRIESFDESRGDLTSILDDVDFLKKNASKDVIAALSAKLVRLYKLAMQRDDSRAQTAISDSLGSGASSGAAAGVGASSSAVRWSDLSQGSVACEVKAKSAVQFYKRALISSSEMKIALSELGDVRCGQDDVRGAVVGTVITICEDAKAKNDVEVLKSCFNDVAVPLAKWLRDSNSNSATSDSAFDSLASARNAFYRLLLVLGDSSTAYVANWTYGRYAAPLIPQRSDYAEIRCEMSAYAKGSTDDKDALVTVVEKEDGIQQISSVASDSSWLQIDAGLFSIVRASDGTIALPPYLKNNAPCGLRMAKNPQFQALLKNYDLVPKNPEVPSAATGGANVTEGPVTQASMRRYTHIDSEYATAGYRLLVRISK